MSIDCLIENDSSVAVRMSQLTPFLVTEYIGSWSWELVNNVLTNNSANSVLVEMDYGYYICVLNYGANTFVNYMAVDEPIISAFFGKTDVNDLGTLYMVSDNWIWISQTWDLTGGGIRTRRNEEFEDEYSLTLLDPLNLIKHYIEIITGPNACFGEDPVVVDYEKYALTFNENSQIFSDNSP